MPRKRPYGEGLEELKSAPLEKKPRQQPAKSYVEQVTKDRPAFGPVPEGFRNLISYPEAGMKLNWSLDKKTLAVQFAENRQPSREEKDILQALGDPHQLGFKYKTEPKQWERFDSHDPAGNRMDAEEMVSMMAKDREGRQR